MSPLFSMQIRALGFEARQQVVTRAAAAKYRATVAARGFV